MTLTAHELKDQNEADNHDEETVERKESTGQGNATDYSQNPNLDRPILVFWTTGPRVVLSHAGSNVYTSQPEH